MCCTTPYSWLYASSMRKLLSAMGGASFDAESFGAVAFGCCARTEGTSASAIPSSTSFRDISWKWLNGWLQRELVEPRVDELVGAIALDGSEAYRLVEPLCSIHVVQG